MNLREYQTKAVEAVHKEWNAGHKRTLVVMPTGTGKTIVFSKIVDDQVSKGEKVLILAHREELLKQASNKLKAASGIETVLEKASSTAIGSDKDVVVGSVQTLCQKNRLKKFADDFFGTIIIDEAHHSATKSYKEILDYFKQAKVLGVTATPDRADMKSLSDVFDSLAFEYRLPEAIDNGFLSKIHTKTIPIKVDISNVHMSAGDFNAGELGDALDSYLNVIADSIIKECQNRKTVVFTPLVRISQRLCKILNEKNFATAEINGTSEDREQILKDFDDGKYKVLTNAMLLTEGWDCPSVDCIICLRPTKSRSLYAQIIGRGTRLFAGKENCLVLDYLWFSGKHDLCHPADIFCENHEVAAKTTKMLADAALQDGTEKDYESDLIQAIKEAQKKIENEKREALRKAEKEVKTLQILKAMRQKRGALVDPLQYVFSIESPELREYQPTFEWEKGKPSQDLINKIEKSGIYARDITGAGLATQLYNEVLKRQKAGMATPKQIRCIEWCGFTHVGRWSKEYASKMLDVLIPHNWRLPNGFVPDNWDYKKKTPEEFKALYTSGKLQNKTWTPDRNASSYEKKKSNKGSYSFGQQLSFFSNSESQESKSKFYAVRGTTMKSRDGVYTNESQAKVGMLGFDRAELKEFSTREEAKKWVDEYSKERTEKVYICGFQSSDGVTVKCEKFNTEEEMLRFSDTASRVGHTILFYDKKRAAEWIKEKQKEVMEAQLKNLGF